MASCNIYSLRFSFPSSSFSSSSLPPFSSLVSMFPSFASTQNSSSPSPQLFSSSTDNTIAAAGSFTWDDVHRVSQPHYCSPDDSDDLTGFFRKIDACNRGSEKQSEFIQFIVDDQIVGFIHNRFVEQLRKFKDVFAFPQSNSSHGGRFGSFVTLNEKLKTPEDRTTVVGEAIKFLGEEDLIPGLRNELYPVTSSFGSRVHFSLERAAAPYFGIKAYGVHMNGFVERNGQKCLWIGKRSQEKPTYPGMLDHLVAGGLPHGISCGENIIKECEEEAGIPRTLSCGAVPVGAVSYMDIDDCRFKRDVLFCYDLELPDCFVPHNQDGEVESFKLIPVTNVANVIRRTHFFKPNCSIVIIDFLFRHGFIKPECLGYLELLQSLKSGGCS